jgi:hypothetical protein
MEPKFNSSNHHMNQAQTSSGKKTNQNGEFEKVAENSQKQMRTEYDSVLNSPEKSLEMNRSYQISVKNFGQLDAQINENKPHVKRETTNRLFVEMELG